MVVDGGRLLGFRSKLAKRSIGGGGRLMQLLLRWGMDPPRAFRLACR